MPFSTRAAAVLFAVVSAPAFAGSSVIFVNIQAPDGGDGSSWTSAFNELHDALDIAQPGQTIWIAQGTYKPDKGTGDRDISYELIGDITLLGGFDGTETEADQRDPDANPTIFSGDLNDDDLPGFMDGPGFGNRLDNSNHVFKATSTHPLEITFDGFTFRDGRTDVSHFPDFGIGVENFTGGAAIRGEDARFIINDCLFTKNLVGDFERELGNFGGAIYIKDRGGLHVTNSIFIGNAAGAGGAIGVERAGAVIAGFAVEIEDCVFEQNHGAGSGAAVDYVGPGTIAIERSVFHDNDAEIATVRCGFPFEVDIHDCVFTDNFGDNLGAGVQIVGGTADPDVNISGCHFENNFAEGATGGCFVADSATVNMANCSFVNNINFRLQPGGGFEGTAAVALDFGLIDTKHTVTNCLFRGNFAGFNGGLLIGGSASVTNCTFVDNRQAAGLNGIPAGFFALGGGGLTPTVFIETANNIFWNNTAGHGPFDDLRGVGGELVQLRALNGAVMTTDFSLIDGFTGELGGVGNFDADPMFIDQQAGDLRLSSGSPAIDTGLIDAVEADLVDLDGDGDTSETIPFDLAGMLRIIGRSVDLGALEHDGTSGADLDGDGTVGAADLAILLGAWGDCSSGNPCPADLDADGTVGAADLALLLGAWG